MHRLFLRLGILLLLSIPCLAQTQGNIPTVIQGNTGYDSNSTCTHTANCINMPESVNTGDCIVGAVLYGNAGSAPSSITDNLSTSFTTASGFSVNTGGPDEPMHVVVFYGAASSSGTDWIIITGGSDFYEKVAATYTKTSCALDGSIVSATANNGNPTGSVSTSPTSTINGDLAVSFLTSGQGQTGLDLGNMQLAAADNNGFPYLLEMFANTTTLGSYTFTALAEHDNGTGKDLMITLLFKPSVTIGLTDTVLPQGANGAGYKAQLHTVGGISGALTYACTGLPFNSVSLNTSTGVISGTPSGTGTTTIGCTVTDGTNTSATDSLPLTIGSGFNTISLGNFVSGGFGNGGSSLSALQVACGDAVVMTVYEGDDTHGGSGWVQPIAGLANYFRDSLNSPVQVFPIYGGLRNGPTAIVVFGPMAFGGSDVISGANNQSASSALWAIAQDVKSPQGVIDVGTLSSNVVTAAGSHSVSYTNPVANELDILAWAGNWNNSVTTVNSPFMLISAFNTTYTSVATSYDLAGAAGSVTGTTNFTLPPNTGAGESTTIIGLRPALAASCAAPSAGEKIRRYTN